MERELLQKLVIVPMISLKTNNKNQLKNIDENPWNSRYFTKIV